MNTIVDSLLKAASYMSQKNLVWGNSGNLSVRMGDSLYITASGSFLAELTEEQLVECPVDQAPINPKSRPSKELPFHQAIYQTRPDVNCVLHASPFYSTMIASGKAELNPNLFIESMYYLYNFAIVPYFHPGSEQLAKAVGAQADSTNVILLQNHGVIVYDVSVREALARLETLEIASRMVIVAASGGIEMNPIEPAIVHDFIANSGYKPYPPRGFRQ
ncbi:class II aldolase/adducin family protein [Alicyclobacillus curvatus]|jgi:3-dehydro-4-phosphotetronate decarboxylase|nr:class II aldolase/adducin family protein [Alicyclobacillus curvatus]